MLGDGGEDTQGQPGRVGIVADDKVDTRVYEVGDKRYAAAEAGDGQRCPVPLCLGKG